MHEEKRKYERFDIMTPADVRLFNNILENCRVDVTNICRGGLSFKSLSDISEGDRVVFDFEPGRIIVRGIVKWVVHGSDSYYCGVEFNEEKLLSDCDIYTIISTYLH